MKKQITLSQAIEGYFLDAHARQLSQRTLDDYANSFRHLQRFLNADPPIDTITPDMIREFLANLRSAPISPNGIAKRPPRKLSKKAALNIHIGLSALWTWAQNDGFVSQHAIRAVKAPKPEKKAVDPFTRDDVERILAVCDRSEAYTRPGKATCSNLRPTAYRDRGIILLLVDTGIRAGELAANPRYDSPGMLVGDVDQRNLQIRAWGKGDQERFIPISHRTMKAIWRYLTTRPLAQPNEPLFLGTHNEALTVSGLRQLIMRLGKRAGVENAHPHRFRHTFAINFLRNGGKTLELQRFLGHSSLEMVSRYVKLARVDLEDAHRRASPVDNWKL